MIRKICKPDAVVHLTLEQLNALMFMGSEQGTILGQIEEVNYIDEPKSVLIRVKWFNLCRTVKKDESVVVHTLEQTARCEYRWDTYDKKWRLS